MTSYDDFSDEERYSLDYLPDINHYQLFGQGLIHFARPLSLQLVKNSTPDREYQRLQISRQDKTVCKINNLTFFRDPYSTNELFKTREKNPHFLRKLPIFKSKDQFENIYIVCKEIFTVNYDIKGDKPKKSNFNCNVYDSIEDIKEKLQADFIKKTKTYSPSRSSYSPTALKTTYDNVKYKCEYFQKVKHESLDQIKTFKTSKNQNVPFNFFHSSFIIKQYLERLLNIQNFKSLKIYPEDIYQQIVKNFFFSTPVSEVHFKNETGIDVGGLRPKLFELLLEELKNHIFQDLNNFRPSSKCNPSLFLKGITNINGTKNKNLLNAMNQLGLSMENFYYILGALLARIILVENQQQGKVISLELNFSNYILYKFCNPSLVDHDWVDMLALLKLDSNEEYQNLIENMSAQGNYWKRNANNKYIKKSKLKRKNTKGSKTRRKSNNLRLNNTIFVEQNRRTMKNKSSSNSSNNSSEETYDKVIPAQKLAHMYLRCVEFYEDNMLPEIYYFMNGFKQGLQKHKFGLKLNKSSLPKKDVIELHLKDLNNLLRSKPIDLDELGTKIVTSSGSDNVSEAIEEKMKKYLISILKEYQQENPALLRKIFIFWFSITEIPTKEIKLTVHSKNKQMVINSHTCFNELVIKESSKLELKKALEFSVNNQAQTFDEIDI